MSGCLVPFSLFWWLMTGIQLFTCHLFSLRLFFSSQNETPLGELFYLVPISSGGAWKYLPGIKGEVEDPGNWREESEPGPGKLEDQRPSWLLSRLFQGKAYKATVREPHCWIKWSTKWAMGMWPTGTFHMGRTCLVSLCILWGPMNPTQPAALTHAGAGG